MQTHVTFLQVVLSLAYFYIEKSLRKTVKEEQNLFLCQVYLRKSRSLRDN